ncbi:Sec-independent protein translocase protein TatB [Gammaproteobacteria bacterium]
MFEIGFWELVMVGVVALIVVGPERLPGLARTAGLWLGKARYFVSSVKAEIDREIKAEELKRLLEEQARLAGVDDFIEETRQGFAETHDALRAVVEPSPPAAGPTVSAAEALEDLPADFRNAFPDDIPVSVSSSASSTIAAESDAPASPVTPESRSDESSSQ